MANKHFMPLAAAIFALLLLAAPKRAEAQWVLLSEDAHEKVQDGLEAMYSLEYAKADELFTQLTTDNPDHPAGYFLLALNDWWRIKPSLEEDAKVDRIRKSFEERLDKTIEVAEARLDTNEFDIVGLFFKGAAYGYRARLKSTYNPKLTSLADWYSIFRDANEGRKALLKCQELAPSNSDVLLGSGLFNYFVDVLPEKHSILKAVNLPPGDKDLGLKMLRIASEKATYSAVEARYALVEIYTTFEKDYRQGLPIAEALYDEYSSNPEFHKYYAKLLYLTSDFKKADDVFVELLKRVKKRQSGYEPTLTQQGLYYLGDIRLRLGKYDEAIKLLEEAVKMNEKLKETGSSWNIYANLKLGYAYDKAGRRNDAVKQYKKVLTLDNYSESHEMAEKYIKAPYS